MRNANQLHEAEAPFQLRGSTFTVMVLRLVDPEDGSFVTHLTNKIRQAPNFFRNAPVVLDLDDLLPVYDTVDFPKLIRRLKELRLYPVGIQGGSREIQNAALITGLPVMPTGRQSRTEAIEGPAADTATPEPVVEQAAAGPVRDAGRMHPTLTITEPVRSGRQIYAAGGDLVVLAPVSPGAEILADGNIHVYGTLRGRALAGVTGDTGARIFCQSLQAELVSIAGLYRVSEDLDQAVYKKSVQIYLDDGYLRMEPLG